MNIDDKVLVQTPKRIMAVDILGIELFEGENKKLRYRFKGTDVNTGKKYRCEGNWGTFRFVEQQTIQ